MLLFAGFGAPPFLSGICKSVCFLAKFSEADACEEVPAPIGSADRPYSASRTMIASQCSKPLRRGTVPLCSATHRLHPAFFRLLLPLPPPSRQRSALRPRSSRGRSIRFSFFFMSLSPSALIRPSMRSIQLHSVGGLSPYAAPRIGYTSSVSASCDLYRHHRGNAPPSARAPRAADPFAFRSSLCLFRYPTSSGRRCVQFSLLYIAKLRQVVRSFPSADPASPFARLCDYRLSPIKRLATFSRTRFMHRKIRRQTHYRLQRKFDRTNKCAFKNL